MASLTRWDPFRDLLSLQRDVDSLLSGAGLARGPVLPLQEAMSSVPATDIFSRGSDMVIRAEMPGIKAGDVDISVTDGVLTVRAERSEEHKVDEKDYVVRESTWKSMERSIRLPDTAKADTIRADYADGILEITVPGAATHEGRTHKVAIEERKTGELPGGH